MTGAELVFDAVVVMTFMAQALNYWLLGKGVLNRYLYLFVLSGFIFTEAVVAVDRPAFWLYVLLSVWGVFNMLRTAP